MRIRVLIVLATASVVTCVSAQQPVILSFEYDGVLTWSNAFGVYPERIASIERLTDVVTTGSPVIATETLAISDGATEEYNYTVGHPPIVNPSVTIGDGTYSWNDVTGSSTNPPVLWGVIGYPTGTVSATYFSHVPVAGTPIEVEYSYLPLSITQDWLSVHTDQLTGSVSEAVVDVSEDPAWFRVVNGPGPMVLIPGGSNSGTNPLASGESYDCWYPASYSLSVGSLYMDRYEVTNDEMVDVMQWAYDHNPPLITVSASTVRNLQGNPEELLDLDAGNCRITWNGTSFGMKAAKGSEYPCVEVSWYGAVAYCNYRSEREGLTPCYDLSDWSCNLSAGGYRLPTSEEWEYAARGGAASKRFPWGGDTISHSQANYSAEGSESYDLSSGGHHPSYNSGTSPVGDFAANPYGLYDMAGNVWEWCNDLHPCYEGIVVRGGCWDWPSGVCRVGYQYRINDPQHSYGAFGFRAVLPPGQ